MAELGDACYLCADKPVCIDFINMKDFDASCFKKIDKEKLLNLYNEADTPINLRDTIKQCLLDWYNIDIDICLTNEQILRMLTKKYLSYAINYHPLAIIEEVQKYRYKNQLTLFIKTETSRHCIVRPNIWSKWLHWKNDITIFDGELDE